MRILIACEYSGRVRQAFAALGHTVLSADFEPAEDNHPNHYQGDCFDLITTQPFDLMIAHPPCTYLSISGLHWNTRGMLINNRPRTELTEEALLFVRRLLAAPIPRIALENPISCISTRIRKPDQIIQPWWFGDDASKATCLWLKNLPPLNRSGNEHPPRWVCCGALLPKSLKTPQCPRCNGTNRAKPRWGNQTDSGQIKLSPSAHRWKDRSRTYPGIAAAMAASWGSLPASDNPLPQPDNLFLNP
jgi:hypothetical protein